MSSIHSSSLPTPIQHVFLLVMENEGVDQIYGREPYETQLANSYAWGGDAISNHQTGYYAICHPSAPNYLGLTSGSSRQCGSDAYNNYSSAQNLFNLLDSSGESWVSYAESMPTACDTNNYGDYAVRHNPVVYFGDLGGNAAGSVCETHNLPIANLTDDYPFNTTPPNFTYIAPNLLNDGHDTSAGVADWFLSQFVSKLVNQSWFSNTAIFVTYDESFGVSPDSGYDGLAGGPVYLASVSPFSKGVGAVDESNDSHYNLLSTIEWLLDLPGTGIGNDSTSSFPPMKGLFNATYWARHSLSGEVTSATTGVPIQNATVELSGGISNRTDSGGACDFSVLDGTYSMTASAEGFFTKELNVTVNGSNVSQKISLTPIPVLPDLYDLSGFITSESTGLPIVGAFVNVSGGNASVSTGGGAYSFILPNGTYSISAQDRGFSNMTLDATIAGSAAFLNFSMVPIVIPPTLFHLSGAVYSGDTGDPLGGANVSLSGGAWHLTGDSGSFDFQVPNGSYSLTAIKTGYASLGLNVSIVGNSVSENLTLRLVKVAPAAAGQVTAPDWWLVFLLGSVVVLGAGGVGILLYRRRAK